MPFAQISDQELFYAARGVNGVPLVFIHGAGDSHLVWNGQLAALSEIARTIAVDLPGHGRSTGSARTSIGAYALGVREFLDALEISRAVIVGTSMGGATAQTFALKFPEHVLGLGLVGTGAKLRVAPMFLDSFISDYEATAHLLVENLFASDAAAELKNASFRQLIATGSAVTAGDYAACDAFDLRERLPEIHSPTFIACGTADRMTPPKYSEYLAKHIPHARLKLIDGAGHMVMLEKPAELNAALREWLVAQSLT